MEKEEVLESNCNCQEHCEDMPVTYCKKCENFYVVDKDGNKEEILIKIQKISSE